MSHKMKCTWPSCSHTAKDQCRTDLVLRSEAHISARTADADEITALRAEVERLRAVRGEYRNRLKQFGADDGSLDAAEQDAIARAALEERT